jgi:hypothetical protein
MALTVFPTLMFNSGTGSDSLASGAGPATAITCLVNGAVTNSTTIVVDTASADLDTIAEDGSAVLFITGIGFVRIDTVDNATLTIVVETAVTIANDVQLAIGGKRATINATESRRLFAVTSSPTAVGAAGRWTLQAEDDGALTITGSTITLAAVGGTGYLLLKGDSASSRRVCDQSALAYHFTSGTASVGRYAFENIKFTNSNGTKRHVINQVTQNHLWRLSNCIIGDSGGTNCPAGVMLRTSGTPTTHMYNCAAIRVTGRAFDGQGTCIISGCEFSRGGDTAFGNGQWDGYFADCIFAHNAGYAHDGGITALTLRNCTIDSNTSGGIRITSANLTERTSFYNCQFTNNGTYGVNCSSATTPHSPHIEYCNFYNNTTDEVNGFTLSGTNLTADPSYTDITNSVRNYAVGASMKAAGFPASTATMAAGQSGSTSYIDIGAVQREEPAASGTIIIEESMQIIPLNNTTIPLVFAMRDVDGAYITGLTPTVTLSKNGGAFAGPSGAVAEIGTTGKYAVAANATDANTAGSLVLNATGTAAIPVCKEFHVASSATIPTVVEIRTEMDDNSTKLAAILTDTGTTLQNDVTAILADTADMQPKIPPTRWVSGVVATVTSATVFQVTVALNTPANSHKYMELTLIRASGVKERQRILSHTNLNATTILVTLANALSAVPTAADTVVME